MARFHRLLAGGRVQRQQDFALDDFCKITSYEKLQPDLDLIAQWSPDLVIVDEAQRVKNWNTIAARALKRIASSHAVVLTGTPLENKLEEVISIVQFAPGKRWFPQAPVCCRRSRPRTIRTPRPIPGSSATRIPARPISRCRCHRPRRRRGWPTRWARWRRDCEGWVSADQRLVVTA